MLPYNIACDGGEVLVDVDSLFEKSVNETSSADNAPEGALSIPLVEK